MWKKEIKIITGFCRCGKSILLFDLFYNYLLSIGVKDEQIIKIELDHIKNYKFRDPINTCKYIEDN